MYKYLVLFLFLLLTSVGTYAQVREETVVNQFLQALKNKDYDQIRATLSDTCKMAGLPSATTFKVLKTVVNELPALRTYEIRKTRPEAGHLPVFAELTYTDRQKGHPDFVLNADHQVTALNIIRNPRISQPHTAELPKIAFYRPENSAHPNNNPSTP